MFSRIIKTLRQPSTLAGLSALAILAGLPPGTVDAAVSAVAGVAALAAVLIDEGGAHAR